MSNSVYGEHMKILLFSSDKLKTPDNVFHSIARRLNLSEALIIFKEIKELENWLRKPQQISYPFISILVAGDDQDLQKLMKIRPLLKKAQIIMVLPDWQLSSINMGHKFYPRYLTSIENNLSQVEDVLRKMTATPRLPEHASD